MVKMTHEKLAELCNARDILCNYCETQDCDKCIVTHLINKAYNDFSDEDVVNYRVPIGRVEYLSTYGEVGEIIEFTDEDAFIEQIVTDSYFGVPVNVVFYGSSNLEDISAYRKFINNKEFSPHGSFYFQKEEH